jgi:hypothetical protein
MKRVEESLEGERSLLDATVRADPSTIDSLLHPNFVERGQFGQRWTREETFRSLCQDAFEPLEISELHGDEVADGVVLVTYVGRRGDSAVERCSLWVEYEGRMVVRWHQGTPMR